MANLLRKHGISGHILDINANGPIPYIVNDLVGRGTTITQNGFHRAIRVDDTIFDNFFQQGVDAETYLGSLHAVGGVTISGTPF
ncbi:MAG: hypothetical protein IT382_03445 [Deltaproteobacteria bacterium]|nr:hypothetical protein [Deltaproteobacteria bacterium]